MPSFHDKLIAFAKSKIPKFDQVLNDPVASAPLAQLIATSEASQKNPQALDAAVTQFLTVAMAGAEYIKAKASGQIDDQGDGYYHDTYAALNLAREFEIDPNTIAHIQQKIPPGTRVSPTGNKAVDGLLTAFGVRLAESNTTYDQQDDYYESMEYIEKSRRQRQIEIHNMLVEQTAKNLQNAEIFKTGQEASLRIHLAQLMATKY